MHKHNSKTSSARRSLIGYESLESKNLLATVSLDATTGLLLIEGFNLPDHVVVSTLSDTELEVQVENGTTSAFALSDIVSIEFNGRGGDDTFINQTNIPSRAAGNGGNDTLEGGTANDTFFGGGGDDTIRGNEGDDILIGHFDNDTIEGGPGDDFIDGFFGDDIIRAGDGNDLVRGGEGADNIQLGAGEDRGFGEAGDDFISVSDFFTTGSNFIDGGEGNDLLWGGRQEDLIIGGEGDDDIRGIDGDDDLRGGAGNDRVRGGDGADLIFGGTGDDNLSGSFRGDRIFGGDGNDTIDGGGGGADLLVGGNGDDILRASVSQGFDRLFGGNGNDTLEGSFVRDLLVGGSGNDIIEGFNGNDEVYGGEGDDLISGGRGEDLLFGQAGNDSIGGGPANDTIYGGPGNDFVRGAGGDDLLFGADGNDRLYGAGGLDRIFGGAGLDGLSGGPDDSGIADVLRGGLDSDRFLTGEQDTIADFQADDAEIEFISTANSQWRHGEVQLIDEGLQLLHFRTGNNRLLVDPQLSNPIVVKKVDSLPDSARFGRNEFMAVEQMRVISFTSFDFNDEVIRAQTPLEVTREFAFNWSNDNAVVLALNNEPNFFSRFESLSGWILFPDDGAVEFIRSGDESQFYEATAVFADDPLATVNSMEDFASIWKLTFDEAGDQQPVIEKVAFIDLLFSQLALA